MSGEGVVQPPTNEVFEEDGPQCIFCRSALKTEGEEEDVEALPCGHTLHNVCIQRCIDVIKKRKIECCPMRCHLSIRNIIMDVDDDGTNGQAQAMGTFAETNLDEHLDDGNE